MILYCFALLNAYVCIVSVGVDMMVVGGIAILFHIFAFIIGYVMLSNKETDYIEKLIGAYVLVINAAALWYW
jgi:membrane associated rhomboid family serine protease